MASSSVHADGRQVDAGPTGLSTSSFRGVISRESVTIKKSQVIEIDEPYATALIAEADIADIVPLSDRALYIVGKKVGSTRLTVIGANQKVLQVTEIEVTPDVSELRKKLKENIPDADIRVSAVSGGILLSGAVHDAPMIEKAVAIATRYAPEGITNALTVASPQQVMLEVRFVEASRTASRELGVSTRGRGSSVAFDTNQQGGGLGGIGPLQTAALLSGAEPFGTILARVLEGGMDVDVMLRALEGRSLARRLAEPNLVTTSGDTASFLAGGEFPFPISSSDNRISIEFKQFGVALAFTPTVLSDGLINLKIAPEVSDIDPSNSVEVNNVRIPGLVVRRTNTTVELKDGQSLAIAGLLQNSHTKNQAQLPWIGQVPVLGALFKSADYQKAETDLVIIVTPHLVKPKRPGEKLRTPLDTPMAGNDVDFFLHGRAEVTERQDRERNGDPKLYGHIIQLQGEKVAHAPSK
ncbi:MAG: type II and III secretion system protein family protein [Hyphomicrobium sp.]|nr:type II and III secretion system protein family protein [Hyphomicrobium sp.]